MFDEAESEGQKGRGADADDHRACSAVVNDSTAEIVKGCRRNNYGVSYAASMFLLGSINVALNGAADESRFSVVQLAKGQTQCSSS